MVEDDALDGGGPYDVVSVVETGLDVTLPTLDCSFFFLLFFELSSVPDTFRLRSFSFSFLPTLLSLSRRSSRSPWLSSFLVVVVLVYASCTLLGANRIMLEEVVEEVGLVAYDLRLLDLYAREIENATVLECL